jgi:hypothetical protein
MPEAVSRRPLTSEVLFFLSETQYVACGKRSGAGSGFSFRFSPVSIISLMLHNHLHVNIVPIRRTGGEAMLFQMSGIYGQESTLMLYFCV